MRLTSAYIISAISTAMEGTHLHSPQVVAAFAAPWRSIEIVFGIRISGCLGLNRR